MSASSNISCTARLICSFSCLLASVLMEASVIIAAREGVYPVYVTSFKCTPDSFAVEYFKAIMESHDKPYLILELDEHDSSVGYETRVEAAIRSFRNHHTAKRTMPRAIDYTPINPRHDPELTRKNVVFPNPQYPPEPSMLCLLEM